MDTRLTLLAAACVLALAACGNQSSSPQESASATPEPATQPVAPEQAPMEDSAPSLAEAPEQAPMDTPTEPDTAASDAVAEAADSDGNTAPVSGCSAELEGNDAMQFNAKSIVVPASCSDFTINLKHTGQLPVAAMGHNVVITKEADMQAVAAAGLEAGASADYVPASDDRVIAHSDLIGGGQSTSVSFAVSKIQGDGPYEFFCSFPGHAALMKGSIRVE